MVHVLCVSSGLTDDYVVTAGGLSASGIVGVRAEAEPSLYKEAVLGRSFGYAWIEIRIGFSAVNKTFFSRPRPRPRPRCQDQDQDPRLEYQDQDQDQDFLFKTKTKTKTFSSRLRTRIFLGK